MSLTEFGGQVILTIFGFFIFANILRHGFRRAGRQMLFWPTAWLLVTAGVAAAQALGYR